MCSRNKTHSFAAPRRAMGRLTLLGILLVLLSGPCDGLGQVPVLSKPMENAASPQVMGPVNQPAGAQRGAGGPGYGEVRWSVLPVGGAEDAMAPPQPGRQSQSPRPVAHGRLAGGANASGPLAGSASRWVAGGVSAEVSPRAFAGSSPSTFSAQPMLSAPTSNTGKTTAASKPELATSADHSSASNDDPISFATGLTSFAPRPLVMPLVKAPTAEGMVIRLIPTADGVQLVLQARTSLAGSILSDQSEISRHGGNVSEGWWAWGAGAGSWSPINVLTSSPLAKPSQPGEGRTHKADPASKADKTPGIATPEE